MPVVEPADKPPVILPEKWEDDWWREAWDDYTEHDEGMYGYVRDF
jgi:hypothetical protein